MDEPIGRRFVRTTVVGHKQNDSSQNFSCLLAGAVTKVERRRIMVFVQSTKCVTNRKILNWFGTSNFSTKPISSQMQDLVIVGGGIVGLATARELLIRHPDMRITVLEKERQLAMHQSAHNSGVIHAGIYYAPGSLKAKLCVEGMKLSYAYLDEHKIPYKKCGKLIVAVEKHELPILDDLLHRATVNGVRDVSVVPGERIHEIEPNCRGLKAIHSPHTGIVNWRDVALSYGEDFTKLGGTIIKSFEVTGIMESTENSEYPVTVRGKRDSEQLQLIQCKNLISCAGLHSDRVAQMTGCSKDPKIIPFRGDFLMLKPEKSYIVRGNIYPVPDPRFPFLGVHFTPRVDGSVWLGPNAVLSLKREGYGLLDFNLKDAWESLTYSGLQRIALKYLRVGMVEVSRAFITNLQVKQLQRYIPQLMPEDVIRGPSGIRAQALNSKGQLVDDFIIHGGDQSISNHLMHVRNAPSPAATSSLAIARLLADKAEDNFNLPSKNS